MTDTRIEDWDPTLEEVLRDQTSAYDDLRRRCPVAHSARLGWSVFRNEDVVQVLSDPETFSNVVSPRRSVPNGMDAPEHTPYRQALEPFFSPERMTHFEPVCRKIAQELLQPLLDGEQTDFIETFALPYAVRTQCAFLGWSEELANTLGEWTRKNRAAVFAEDGHAIATNARLFETYMKQMVDARRGPGVAGKRTDKEADVTDELVRTVVKGGPLTLEDLTSIFRNWTVGEVGSITAAMGTLARELALRPELQAILRRDHSTLPNAIEELLRINGPLVMNRRRATKDVTLGGRSIAAGEQVSVMWISANRDEQVFVQAEEAQINRDQSHNLLWGAGVHVCPGAPLARLEMRVALEELLARTLQIQLGDALAARTVYPENGWASLPLRLKGRKS